MLGRLVQAAQHDDSFMAEPAMASPPSTFYRFRKFANRNRVMLSTMTLVATVLTIGLVGTGLALLEANRQADRVRVAQKQTEQQLAQTEKGLDLLAGLLNGINPRNEEKGGPGLLEQLRERADKAANELQGESIGDSLAVARMQTILGNTLRELDSIQKAIGLLEKAITTRSSELGPDHPDTLTSMSVLGLALFIAGRYDESVQLGEQVLKGRRGRLGVDHSDTIGSMQNLAMDNMFAGRHEQGVLLYEEALAASKMKHGAESPATLSIFLGLAEVYNIAGKPDRALPFFEQVFAWRKETYGPDHISTLETMNQLSVAYRKLGKFDQAVEIADKAFSTFEAKLGPNHNSTLTSKMRLAMAYELV